MLRITAAPVHTRIFRMRLILVTQGTLGDHLPMIGLAQQLMQSGFEVLLACNDAMHRLVQSAGVQPLSFGIPLSEIEASHKALCWDHWKTPPLSQIWSEDIEERLTSNVASLIEQLTAGDILIGAKNIYFLSLVAQVSNCQLIEIGLNAGSMIDFSRLAVAKDSKHSWATGLKRLELRLRRRWLQSSDSSFDLVPLLRLHAIPDFLAPRHYPLLDAIRTGFWCYQHPQWNDWKPADSLLLALKGRHSPLGLVFSSQPLDQPVQVLAKHLDVAQRLGRRLAVVKGWAFGEESQLLTSDLVVMLKHPDLIVVDPLPLNWLFQRLDAVFIHGGMGTLARALQARCRTVIEPYGNDQFLNARLAIEHDLALAVHPYRFDSVEVADALRFQLARTQYDLHHDVFEGLPRAVSLITELLL